MITIATPKDLTIVQKIVSDTINDVYPNYYPLAVVSFFLNHHSEENILIDLHKGNILLLLKDEEAVATGTICDNQMNRVFVLPQHQGKGYGSEMMNFIEEKIRLKYNFVELDSSLPAFNIYTRRGYFPIEYHEEKVDDRHVLCYQVMKKELTNTSSEYINLNGKVFINTENSDTGEVSENTLFYYHQHKDIIWATYSGGIIEKGYLTGKFTSFNSLEFTYQHINDKREIRIGKCKSQIKQLANGKLSLHETWQWLDKEQTKGKSTLEEISK